MILFFECQRVSDCHKVQWDDINLGRTVDFAKDKSQSGLFVKNHEHEWPTEDAPCDIFGVPFDPGLYCKLGRSGNLNSPTRNKLVAKDAD